MGELEHGLPERGGKHRSIELTGQPYVERMCEDGPPLRGHSVSLPHCHCDHVAQRECQPCPLRRSTVEKVKIGIDLPAQKGGDQWILHLPWPMCGEVDDIEFHACKVQRMQICARCVPVAGSVENVAVIREADFFTGGAVAVESWSCGSGESR